MSLKYSANTEKSPQPGHHVGLSAASSFLVSGFLSISTVSLMKLFLLQLSLHAGQHVFHTPSQSVGLVNALDLGIAVFGP